MEVRQLSIFILQSIWRFKRKTVEMKRTGGKSVLMMHANPGGETRDRLEHRILI